MMNNRYFNIALLCAALLLPAGCGGNVKDSVRGTLGLNRESPDEFAVIKRAPLEMPKSMTLPTPVPGMQRPQEKATDDAAKEAVFGEEAVQSSANQSSIEELLLEKTGADAVPEDIRDTVNSETDEMAERNKPVATKLLDLATDDTASSATIVDSKAEYERIKKNLEEGKSILEGDTPVIEDY